MPHTEYMKFSPAQMHVLRVLDGATGPVQMDGTYSRTLKSLKDKDMVKYTRRTEPSPTFYYPGGTTLLFSVSLTEKGWRYLYEGGIDK